MIRIIQVLAILFLSLCLSKADAQTQNSPLDRVKWQQGPSVANLGTIAEINVPGGYVFANGDDTRVLMEAMQNPSTGQELGFIAPQKLNWFIVFEYDDVGYIRDDEKSSLDPEAMLESIKTGTEVGNKERARRGWPALTITGWEQKPHYDESTHNLEWAIKGESQGQLVINFNTRLLGRSGVMRVTLVDNPSTLNATVPTFKSVLTGFRFKPGQKYAEFRQGDKIAEYGLSALVVGGATAVAVKSGALKWLWKIGVFAVVAVVGLFKRLFGGRKSS